LHWRSCAAPPSLQAGELHLWRIDADAPLAHLDALGERILSSAERARAARLRLPKLRRRFILTHLVSRQIFAGYLDCAPQALVFNYSPTGKPGIQAPNSALEFNLSTTGDLALLAVRLDEPLGLDCELLRESVDVIGIARRMFGVKEAERLARLHGKEQQLAFYLAWTALEARVKRDGRGLSGYRQMDAPDIDLYQAHARADAVCALAGRALPQPHDWLTLLWQD
jgi:4'-phosphopantetheinyl transferase